MRPLEVHPPGVTRGADLPAQLTVDALLDVALNVILNHLTKEGLYVYVLSTES